MILNEEQAKEYCKQEDNTLFFLKSKYGLDFGANNKKPINCIVHNDNNASMFFKFGRLHCFGCGAKLDIFNVIQRMENVSERESFEVAYKFFNIEVEREDKHYKSEEERKAYEERKRKAEEETKRKLAEFKKKQEEKALKEKQEEEKQIEVYKQLFEYAKQNKDKAVAYLASRSINKEYANSLENIGFYNLTSAIAEKIRAPRIFIDKDANNNDLIIVKVKDNFYIQRFVSRATNSKYKYLNATGLHSTIYNEKVLLNNKDFVFIVEGLFDCMSIESIGKKAIALNSTSNVSKLIDFIKENKTEIDKDLTVVLLCDNDSESGAGATANKELLKNLRELGIKTYIKTDILQKESVKDMNELITKDAERAKEVIAKAVEEVKEEVKKEKENFCLEYKDGDKTIKIESDFVSIPIHKNRIERTDRKHITTGFKQLDRAINRGLTTGLYIIGAKAGTGKTAFLLQVSDYIARTQNQKVLFFSLEQGKNALFNRRIARITFEQLKEERAKNGDKVYREDFDNTIADFQAVEFYGEDIDKNISTAEKRNNIYKALFSFGAYANNVFTIDNIYTVEEIKQVIESCIKQNIKPIVFIDYLQLLKPNGKDIVNTYEERQLINESISELKKIITKNDLIVFLVSSLTKQGKETELNAFLGSAGIGFNAEFAGTLQIDENYYRELIKKTGKNEIYDTDIRAKIQAEFKDLCYKRLKLSILKQKDGISGIDIDLKQYSSCYYYEEVEDKDSQSQETEKQTETAEQEKPPKRR